MRMLPRIRPIFPARTSKRFSQNTGFILKYRPLPCRLNARFLEEYNRNDTRNRFGRGTEIRRPNYEQKKQTEMIADHIYGKYDVFKRFKPLARHRSGFDCRFAAIRFRTDCTRPRQPLPPSALSESLGARRQTFRFEQPFQRRSYPEEQAIAQNHPFVQQALQQQSAQAAAETPSVEAEAAESSAAE